MDIATRDRLQRLASERQALISEMEKAEAVLPRLIEREDGIFRISTSLVAQALLQRCYDDDWIDRDMDWVTWTESSEYEELRRNRTKIQTASPEQISRLLTALVRQERFCYGGWAEAVQSGLLKNIVERATLLSL